MEMYYSQLSEFLKYLEPHLIKSINQLIGEINDFIPAPGIEILKTGERELRNPRGKIRRELMELVKETTDFNEILFEKEFSDQIFPKNKKCKKD
ncbi:hypothetical protein [Bacillus toyonensis]|uniref:hypothetical protein n=1 Tax=Bacillus toyonensis TaxID=155322 RepID=UPI0011569198|nr:hypothetical protein [Bacillus toyonensis]